MPSKLKSSFHAALRMILAAAALGALLLSAAAAPLEGRETSGEAEKMEGNETLSQMENLNILKKWEQVIDLTKCHKEEFDKEFQGNANYNFLDKEPSFPNCSFTKEAFLQEQAQGLLTYMVLLKHAEKEYPNYSTVTNVKGLVPQLITQIIAKMQNSEQVKKLTSNQEQQLLKELDDPDTFTRKLRAHSILYSLRNFLIDGKKIFRIWENEIQATNETPNECRADKT